MKFSKDYEDLAEIIVSKFRDENFKDYLEQKEYCLQTSKEEFVKLFENMAEDLAAIEKERFEFYNSLSTEQRDTLDKLILKSFDAAAFNVLREIEENLDEHKSIGLTINGKPVEQISNEFWSGTCFGEYLMWLEQKSNYGKYQH
ncbi:MAG: hypothetical protein NXI00_07670 [Cytophagales bacterium]|nr:hypothetical protein [Cytophagales bacterium]